MDKLEQLTKSNLNFFINQNIQIDLQGFILSLLCAAILSFLVQLFYIRYSSTLSNRKEFAKTFVVLGVTTCIVIMIVKSSLALSLGLVGALSIVRFRAAIKEPEELVYLFFIIGIGLANGANQFLVSIICTFFIILILFIKKYYDDKKNDQNLSDSSVNVMQIEIANSKEGVEKIIDILKTKTTYLKLKSFRVEKDLSQYVFWFDVNKNKVNDFMQTVENLKTRQENISIHVYSRTGIYE